MGVYCCRFAKLGGGDGWSHADDACVFRLVHVFFGSGVVEVLEVDCQRPIIRSSRLDRCYPPTRSNAPGCAWQVRRRHCAVMHSGQGFLFFVS